MILQSDAISNLSNKQRNLFLGILFDLIGMLTYLIPFFGEFADTIWAPLSGILLAYMYKGVIGKVGGAFRIFRRITSFYRFYTNIYTYLDLHLCD